LRASKGFLTVDQAKVLQCSIAFVSAVELGKKPVPDHWPRRIALWLDLEPEEASELADLAEIGRKLEIIPHNLDASRLTKAFANRLADLSSQDYEAIQKVLGRKM
jgi:hypothetical protein